MVARSRCATLPGPSTRTRRRSQTGDVTVRHAAGSAGKQPNLSLVTLQQHLGDGGGAAEVAVDLKRRVRVEHVGVGTLGTEQELQDVERVVNPRRASPEVAPTAVAQPVA